MTQDHFDHIFIEPSSYDASLAFYRDGLGWQLEFSWGGGVPPEATHWGTRWFIARDPDGNLLAFEQPSAG